MAVVTKEQLESFHRFASQRIDSGDNALSLSELLQLWLVENPTQEEQEDAHAAIRQGIEDIKAGRGRPAEEVMNELRDNTTLPLNELQSNPPSEG